MLDLQPAVVPAQPRRRSRLRAVFVAALSAFVVLAAAVYVLAPADASVRLRVDETTTAQPYDAVAMPRYTLVSKHKPSKRPRYTEVVYGKVDARGVPVSRIFLQLRGAERANRKDGVTIPIRRANVAYRTVLHLRPGKYRYTLSLRVGNRTRSASVTRLLRNKHYYRVSAIVRPSGIITFLPVTSY